MGLPPVTTNHHAISNLEEALKTYIDRNKKYGNNYKRFGLVMMALFPDGLNLNTVEDFNRYGVIFMKIAKLSRYATNPKVGHLDSVHDDIVYSAMLEELDSEAQGLPVQAPVELITTVKPSPVEASVELRPRQDVQFVGFRGTQASHSIKINEDLM